MAGKRKSPQKESADTLVLDLDAVVISPEIFRKAVIAFTDLLINVAREVAGKGKKIRWSIAVKHGSALIAAKPVSSNQTLNEGKLAVSAIADGVRRLEKGAIEVPPYFNQEALNAAHTLALLNDPLKQKLKHLRLRSETGNVDLTPKSATSVERLNSEQRQAYGSIEGHLQTISQRGQLQFIVYDALFDRGINCFVDESTWDLVIAAFGKRVSVSGLITYSKDNRPVGVRVQSIRVFKDLSKLPDIKSLRGIFNKVEAA